MAETNAPVQDDEEKREPGPRVDVMLDDIDKSLKKQAEDDKAAAAEAEAKKKAELEAKARQEALAAAGDDPRIKALQEALRISEEARQRQAASLAPEPKVEEHKRLSREELNELYQRDPLAAIAAMQEESIRTVSENLEKRLSPLVSGGAQNARQAAKARHPDAFELFGREIDEYVEALPDKTVLNNPRAWDDLVSYIQGQPGNIDKIVTKRQEKKAEEARLAQAASAGAHTKSEMRAPAGTSKDTLDETEKEIARALNPGLTPEEAYAEYNKWRRVAS